jgi:hypothetical protein
MSATNSPASEPMRAACALEVPLTDREIAILRATRSHSLSTVAIAEEVGLGNDPLLVTPLLERLVQLEMVDGFYAAGRVMTSSAEVHRRYYRLSDRGQQVV